MKTLDLWKTERELAAVEPETGLKILRTGPSQAGKWFLQIWNPKATKPYTNYSFKTEEAREKYVAEQIAGHKSHNAQKAKWKAERQGTAADMEKVQIGDIFCNSWGYEQTNVDFYEVVGKSGRSVTVREIGCKTVPNSTVSHGMADYVVPVKGAFLEKSVPIQKLVSFSGGHPHLTMKHGSCSKTSETEKHYRSWYA